MAFASKSALQLTALALALSSIGAQADTFTWATDVSGLWTIPTSWTPLGPPTQGSDVIISVTGMKTITHNLGNDSIHTLNFEASATDPNAVLLVNSGSSLAVTAGGTNGGVIRADNGTVSFNGGTLVNNGTLNAINNGTIAVSGTTIQGGTLATLDTGSVSLANSSFLDAVANGPMTLSGNIVSATNQTSYIAGTFTNNGNITVGVNSDLIVQGNNNATLNGTGTVSLLAGNSRLFGANGADLLTIGSGQTVQGVGQLGINQLRVANSGLITANQSGGTLQIDPSDGVGGFTNTGTLRAENGGTLALINGTYTNAGGTIAALAGSTVNISGASIQGGNVSTTGTGAVAFSNSSLIDGSSHGAVQLTGANIRVADNQTVYGIGTINGSLAVNTNADLRIQGTNNLTLNGGTTTLVADNSRIFGDIGTDILTNTASNTIQGRGQIGANQTFVTNAGLITANIQGATLQLDPSDGDVTHAGLTNTGTLRAENGGNLNLLTGYYDNSAGHITATGTGSTVTLTNSANIQGGVLTATGGGTINLANSVVLDGATRGAMTLNGPVLIQDNQTVYAIGTLTDNTLTVGNNADLRIQGQNNLTLTGGKTTLVADSSRILGDSGNDILTNTANNTIQGRGQIGINSIFVKNAGLITANVQGATLQLDPSDGTVTNAGLINTGTLRAENGGNLQFIGGVYDNSAGLVTAMGAGSTVTLTNSAVLQGGTISATNGGAINVANSVTLDGLSHGALTLNGPVSIQDNQTVYGLGTITDNTLTVGNNADFRIQGQNNLTLTGGMTTLVADSSRILGDNGNDILTNTANNTIQGRGQIGVNQVFVRNAGLITANVQGAALTLDPSDGDSVNAGFINTGTLRAENGGALRLLTAHYNNQAGTISALAGSNVDITNSAVLEGGLLTTAGTGAFNIANSAVLDGAAHGAITINGNANIASGQTVYATGSIVNNGTFTQLDNSDLRIQGATNLTLSGTGTYVMTAGNSRILADNGNDILTNASGHTIAGLGQIGVNQINLTNAGTINANVSGQALTIDTTAAVQNQASGVLRASNGGVLNILDAVNGTGTIRSDSGGTVILNQASTTGQLINNGNLQIAGVVTVSSDYNNANFGVGNAFNRNANVTGSGAIVASGNVGVGVIGANVTTIAGTGASALTIGNVRVGANTFNYQVANTGTSGPAIRGAIQTQFSSGSSITDSRLSGSGVTAGNYGPIAAGAQSGAYGVTFTAASAGTLAPLANSPGYGTGQAVFIADNFSNVVGRVLQINLADGAAAYNAAIGSATPSPIAFGNVRVGTADSRALTVSNTQTAGAYSEDLNAAFGAASGSASSIGSLTGLKAGSSNSGALNASLDTSTAGAKTGNVTINYATAGTVNGVSNGLGTLGVGSQTIALSGNVYNAAVGSTTPSPVTVANQRIGGTNSSALTVANTAAAGNFSEALNANFGATSAGVTNNGGSVTNLAAGSSNSSALAVGVNTASSGAKSGNVTIAYQTDGTGTNGHSGLSAIGAGSQSINVNGNVYQTAAGTITTAPLNFGTVQVGQNVSQILNVKNSATGAAGFVEDLNASFGAATGTGSNRLSGSGNIAGLTAGSSSNALTVGVNTSSAGSVNASIAVNFFSAGAVNGVSNGLGTLAVGSAGYGVSGTINGTANVVDQAQPVINNSPIALGNVRIGSTSPTGLVSVTNHATGNQQAALNASISGNAPVTASGSFNLLAPGATNNTSLSVGLNTATAGNKSGTATIAFVSDASNIGNCGTACQMSIGSQDVAVTGAVYRLANPNATPTSVTVAGRVGSASPTTALTIANSSPDIYTEGLSVTRGATSAGFTSTGAINNLAAGGSSNAIGVTLNTATAGTFRGTQALNYVSTGQGTDGAADLAIGSGSVTLNGKVYTTAAATNNTPAVNFGIVHVGDTASRNVSVTNSAAVTALNDTLVASAAGATGPFTTAGNVSGLAAGNTSTALSVGLNTGTAGMFSGSAAFSAASHDADLSDKALANLAVSLSGQVNNYASDAFTYASGAGNFTQVGSTYILDYGTVAQNSGTRTTTLTADNTAVGPADSLAGSFQFLDPADFGESGFASFLALAAGQSTGPLTLSFDSLTAGSFSDTIVLHGVGSNASGYSGALGDIELIVRGVVTGGVTPPPGNNVPEPDSLILLGLGIPLLFLRRGRKSRKLH